MGDAEMNGQARQRELGDAVEAALKEQAGAERYQRRQRQARRGKAEAVERPRPLEFDGNGFPVAQRIPSFVTRVSRLLGPS
jgi:hypothetical protein